MSFLEHSNKQSVNLALLDSLVLDFLAYECGCLKPSVSVSEVRHRISSTSTQTDENIPDPGQIQRLSIICNLISDNNIPEAIQLLLNELQTHPDLLDSSVADQCLLLLYKLHVIKLLSNNSLSEALSFIKSEVVPIASKTIRGTSELKSMSLLFFTFKHSPNTPSIQYILHADRRKEISSYIQTQFLSSFSGKISKLGAIFRYLTSVHQLYCISNGIDSSYPFIERLLLP
ncbi:hypothetical protein GEMRC1_013404 [Eukaryota sp. GEM-RC1]